MAVALELSIADLAREFSDRHAQDKRKLLKTGAFSAIESTVRANRRQTLFILQPQFLILIDEFERRMPAEFSLSIGGMTAWSGGRRRYLLQSDSEPWAVHPLGDYATKEDRLSLTWLQRLARGRFMIVLTRDLEAKVRVLNGWAVEIRSGDKICCVMHSNRAGKLRPLGPIQTDARFALAEYEKQASSVKAFRVLQAKEVLWGDNRRLFGEKPFDLEFQSTS